MDKWEERMAQLNLSQEEREVFHLRCDDAYKKGYIDGLMSFHYNLYENTPYKSDYEEGYFDGLMDS